MICLEQNRPTLFTSTAPFQEWWYNRYETNKTNINTCDLMSNCKNISKFIYAIKNIVNKKLLKILLYCVNSLTEISFVIK